jgi:hypothetical protein
VGLHYKDDLLYLHILSESQSDPGYLFQSFHLETGELSSVSKTPPILVEDGQIYDPFLQQKLVRGSLGFQLTGKANLDGKPGLERVLLFGGSDGGGKDLGSLSIYDSTDQLIFSRKAYGSNKSQVIFFDADGDQLDDIVFGETQDGSVVIFGWDSRSRSWAEKARIKFDAPSENLHSPVIALMDMEADGRSELVVAPVQPEGLYVHPRGWLLKDKRRGNITALQIVKKNQQTILIYGFEDGTIQMAKLKP